MNVVGERVAVVVVGEVLEQRAADALHDAARDLALDDVRVDHRAAVLADDVAQQRRPARSSTSTSHVHTWVAFAQIDGALGGVPRARLEPGRDAGRQRCRVEVGERGDLGERDADRGRAAHVRPAARRARCRRPRPRAGARRWRRSARAGSPAVSRTAPAIIDPLRLPPVPAPKPVTAVSPWIVLTSSMSHAERVGGELDDGRLEAVPGRAAGDVHVDRARRLDADRRALGRVDAEARRRRLDVVRDARRRGSGRAARASACSARKAS